MNFSIRTNQFTSYPQLSPSSLIAQHRGYEMVGTYRLQANFERWAGSTAHEPSAYGSGAEAVLRPVRVSFLSEPVATGKWLFLELIVDGTRERIIHLCWMHSAHQNDALGARTLRFAG